MAPLSLYLNVGPPVHLQELDIKASPISTLFMLCHNLITTHIFRVSLA